MPAYHLGKDTGSDANEAFMADNHDTAIEAILSLADWRRQMAALYPQVSTSENLADNWPYFIQDRTRLYNTHPQSTLQKGK